MKNKNIVAALLFMFPMINQASAETQANTSTGWDKQYYGYTFGVSQGNADVTAKSKVTDYFVTTDPDQLDPEGTRELDGIGLNGSIFWGLNRQSGKMLYGLEADLSMTSFNEKYSSGDITYISFSTATFSVSTEVKSGLSASLRGRLGYAQDKYLMYATAGFAWTQFEYSFAFSDTYTTPESASVNESKITQGIVAGFGVDYKLQSGLTLKAEYLYSTYDDILSADSSLANVSTDGFTHKVNEFQTHNIRVGVIKWF